MDSGEAPAKTTRPPASAHLLIDSLDRYNSESDAFDLGTGGAAIPGNDFRIQRNQALLYGYFTRLGITQIQMQWRVPTIAQGRNDTLWFDVSGGSPFFVTLAPGFFDPSGLALNIKDQVTAAPGTPIASFDCVFNPVTGGLFMSSPSTEFKLILDPTPGANQSVSARTLKTIGANYINNFGTDQYFSAPTLSYTRYIDIISDRLTKYQRVKDGQTIPFTAKQNIVARVYAVAPNQKEYYTASTGPGYGPFDLVWDPNTPKHIKWSDAEAIYELDFRLYDEYGELLFWNELFNTEFQLTILASES